MGGIIKNIKEINQHFILREEIEDIIEKTTKYESDYKTCLWRINKINKKTYKLIKGFKPSSEFPTYTKYIRKHKYWKQAKLLNCLFNTDFNGGVLICEYCEKEITSLKKIVLHHKKYDIKNYFDYMENCCIIHYDCHQKIHGWD